MPTTTRLRCPSFFQHLPMSVNFNFNYLGFAPRCFSRSRSYPPVSDQIPLPAVRNRTPIVPCFLIEGCFPASMVLRISVHGFYQRTRLSCSPTKGNRSASGKVLHASGHKVGKVRKNTDILCCEWRLLHKQSSRHHHRSHEVMESTTIRCVKSTSSGYN